MADCFHCGAGLVWNGDFTFEDFGMEGEGLVHTLSCSNCNADVVYFIPENTEEEKDED